MEQIRQRRRLITEMNVVPYIDVMLVLLVIFMITAPLLSQGVKVELPKASAEPIQDQKKESLIVSVDKDGNFYLNVGGDPEEVIERETLLARVAAVLRQKADTPVYVRGDRDARYEAVVDAMVALQTAGAGTVGLITETPSEK